MKQQFKFRFPTVPYTDGDLFMLKHPEPLTHGLGELNLWCSLFDNNNTDFREVLYNTLNQMSYSLNYSRQLSDWKSFKAFFKSNTNGRNIRISNLKKLASDNLEITPFAVHITHCDSYAIQTRFINLTEISGCPAHPQGLWEVKKENPQQPSVVIHDFGPGGPLWFEVSY